VWRTPSQPATQPASHVAVAITLNAQASSLKIGRGSARHSWLRHHFQGQKIKSQLTGDEGILWRPQAQLVVNILFLSNLNHNIAIRYRHQANIHHENGGRSIYPTSVTQCEFRLRLRHILGILLSLYARNVYVTKNKANAFSSHVLSSY